MNKQLRKLLKRETFIDYLACNDAKNINVVILNTEVGSFDGATPLEMF
jgi:hypothetical protein